MSKLGLVITVTENGFSPIKSENTEGLSWSKAVIDERQLLQNFKQAEGERRFVTFISFLEDGCLLTVMRPLDGSRGGDNLTAWVFIPRTVKLSREDFQSILDRVKNSLGCNNDGEMDGILGDTFTKEYEDCKHPLKYKPSASDGHLAKYVVKPDFNAFDFLERRYQPKYPTYKYVFILGEKDSLEIKPEAKFDTIAENPRPMCLLLAPDKSKLGKGTCVYLRDGAEFVGQIQACKGEKTTLILKRGGFKEQEITVTFEKEVQELTKEDFKNISWIKTIVKSQFRVVNKKSRQQISAFSVTINGKPLGLSGCDLKEGDLQNAQVIVTAEGYKEWKDTRDLGKAQFDDIELDPKVVTKECNVLLSDGQTTAKVTWQEDVNRLGDPLTLPGYEITGVQGKTFVRNDSRKKSNKSDAHKGSRSKTNWRDFLMGAASALLLISLLAVAGYFVFFKDGTYQLIKGDRGTPQTTESNEVSTPNQQTEQTSTNRSEVGVPSLGKRLNSIIEVSWTLKKSDLDSIPGLQGLYDDLNNFKFNNLRKKWKTQLDGSEKFKNIISRIGDLPEDSTNGQFTGKKVIKIDDYEQKIEKLKSKAKGSGAQNGKGNTNQKASSSEESQGNV